MQFWAACAASIPGKPDAFARFHIFAGFDRDTSLIVPLDEARTMSPLLAAKSMPS